MAMARKNHKKMEIEDLAVIVKKEIGDVRTTTKKEIEDLAVMVKRGFDDVDKRFNGVNGRFDEVGERLESLETGQEEIKLRLTNVAYRFELEELERRVFILEKKTGISRK